MADSVLLFLANFNPKTCILLKSVPPKLALINKFRLYTLEKKYKINFSQPVAYIDKLKNDRLL